MSTNLNDSNVTIDIESSRTYLLFSMMSFI